MFSHTVDQVLERLASGIEAVASPEEAPPGGALRPQDHQLLDLLAPALQRVHHIPGRLRLRLRPELQAAIAQHLNGPRPAAIDLERLRHWLLGLPGIRAARLNLQAASLVLEYDPRHIAPQWWEERIAAGEPG